MKTRFLKHCALAVTIITASQQLPAQYNLQAWFNFEDGQIPSQLVLGHYAGQETLKVGQWQSMPQLSAVSAGIARTEVGSAGLLFQPVKGTKPHVSLIATTSMDRRRLAPGWKAVYQADFYLDEPGKTTPTVALLAITPNEGTKFAYNFYRFGVLEGGERLFFSFANNTAEPVLTYQQPISDYELQRPGWHRFQIIFDGPEQIAFAVDTIPTSFSPITETTLTTMHPGLMVTATKSDLPMLVDNLSIQWTSEPNSALPESPWSSKLASRDVASVPTTGSGAGAAPTGGSVYDESSSLKWNTDKATAWQAAQDSGKPLLIMFYAPKIAPYAYLNSITPAGAASEDLFNKFTLLRVDANQLAGGKLAADYKIFRLPTFVVIGPNSQEKGRAVVVHNNTKWEDLQGQLSALAN